MCEHHGPSPVSRRLVLKGAATGAAALALLGVGSSPALAQDGAEAWLADGSGDSGDRPGQRELPSRRTSSTTELAATAATGYVSQNGWDVPTTNDSAAIGIGTFTVPGTSVRLSVKSGDVATVLVYVAQRFVQMVQGLNANCGGYSWRENVNSPGTWSNHASGTAIDLNWDLHPNGATGTFTAPAVEAIRRILSECRGVVRWGGDYTSTRDEMHFEINVLPGDTRLSQLAQDLRTAQPRRVAAITGSGTLAVKEGNLYGAWVTQGGAATKVALDCTRVAAVLADGTAVVKDGSLGGDWVVLATGAADIALGGGRIAVVGKDGSLRVKSGSIYESWTVLRTSGVTRVVLTGTRIAAIYKGASQVKDGSVGASWVTLNSSVTDIALDARRLVVIEEGLLKCKEGDLTAGWVTLARGDGVRLSGDRIGMISGGNAFIKQGVYGSWVTLVAGGVTDMVLDGDRISVVQDGRVLVKEGSIYAGWVTLTDGARQVVLAG